MEFPDLRFIQLHHYQLHYQESEFYLFRRIKLRITNSSDLTVARKMFKKYVVSVFRATDSAIRRSQLFQVELTFGKFRNRCGAFVKVENLDSRVGLRGLVCSVKRKDNNHFERYGLLQYLYGVAFFAKG